MRHPWDVSEDTPNVVEEVLSLPEEEAKQRLNKEDRLVLSSALHLLNHHNSPDRESHIRAIGAHPLARSVKLNDLRHKCEAVITKRTHEGVLIQGNRIKI